MPAQGIPAPVCGIQPRRALVNTSALSACISIFVFYSARGAISVSVVSFHTHARARTPYSLVALAILRTFTLDVKGVKVERHRMLAEYADGLAEEQRVRRDDHLHLLLHLRELQEGGVRCL